MLTKADITRIKALHRASERKEQRLFLCEGFKLVRDMLGYFSCEILIISQELYPLLQGTLTDLPTQYSPRRLEVVPENFAFHKISTLQTPQPIAALFEIPKASSADLLAQTGLIILLDNVQDPGNVGTIIRTANWFGVEHILLTEGSADPFSPKVVQASMGALSQVHVSRLEQSAADFLSSYQGKVYGTFLDGESIYTTPNLPKETEPALLVMGNEGNGIGIEVEPYITHRLLIPPHRADIATESLNVAIATAICLSELKRPTHAL